MSKGGLCVKRDLYISSICELFVFEDTAGKNVTKQTDNICTYKNIFMMAYAMVYTQ